MAPSQSIEGNELSNLEEPVSRVLDICRRQQIDVHPMNRGNRRQILDMLARGRLTVDEAERLLLALERDADPSKTPVQPQSRAASYLCVLVTSSNNDDDEDQTVDIRIPMATLKAGLRLSGLLPGAAMDGINRVLADRGVELDVRQLKGRDTESLLQTLQEVEIDVNSRDQRILIYVE